MKNLINACNECNVSINSGDTPRTEETTMTLSIDQQLGAIERIMKKQFNPEDQVHGVCPLCNKEASLLYHGANCRACHTMIKLMDAVEDASTAKERQEARMDVIRARFIRKTYGDDILCNEEIMFNVRNLETITTEANQCGVSPSQILSRIELEEYNMMAHDYESEELDYEDLEIKPKNNGDLTRDVVKMIQNMSEDKAEELVEEDTVLFRDSNMEYESFITQEQKQLNFDFYVKKLKNERRPSTIGWIGKLIFDAIQGSLRTFTITEDNEEKEITVPTFFPRGMYKEFWAIYKEEKERAENLPKASVEECLEAISRAQSIGELKRLKQKIYKESLSYNNKKYLWDSCDQRMQLLIAA